MVQGEAVGGRRGCRDGGGANGRGFYMVWGGDGGGELHKTRKRVQFFLFSVDEDVLLGYYSRSSVV